MGQENLVVSYLQLRKAIGIIGCALPVVLPLGTMLYGMIYPDEYQSTLQSSISGYYYTAMRNYFVGSLCAIALFLFAYQYQGQDGERSPDNIAGNIAGFFALLVAFIPTAPDSPATTRQEHFGTVHLLAAGAFFIMLAFFSLYLFVKTDSPGNITPEKRKRNIVYRICGWTMLACIVLIVFLKLMTGVEASLASLRPVFWLEALAVIAFGVSWLVKGETFWEG